MKKLLIAVVAIVVAFFVFVYFFIPAQIEFQVTKYAVVNPTAATRVLMVEKNWHKWWPQQKENHQPDSEFFFKNSSFTISHQLYNAFKIDVANKNDSIHSLLSVVPTSFDTTQLQWNAVLNTSSNPFKRIERYWGMSETKQEMEAILASLVSFLQKQENVYGMQIKREIVKDTLLVFKEEMTNAFPSTSSIYKLVGALKNHIKEAGANETNSPMMNVIELGPGKYRVMVAIPVDREFTATNSISFRRMVQGYILVSDITGGPVTIKNASIEMRTFVNDYSKIPIALPFELMVTDRIAEPDTSKWVTRLYFPIVL